jgi:protein SCO1
MLLNTNISHHRSERTPPSGHRIFARRLRAKFLYYVVAIISLSLCAGAQGMFGAQGFNPPAPANTANGARPPILREVGFDQNLNAQLPLDTQFYDESGKQVRLKQYFTSGKPIVLALVYYQCPMLCSEVLAGLTTSLTALRFDAGKDFQVLAVSFDPKDTPESAAAKKKLYLQRYRRPGTDDGWHFLTGDPPSIRMLTDAVGFHYTWDEKNKQFAHVAGIVVLTPDGKVSRYFYGIEYAPRDLKFGLIDASSNKIGSLVDQALLFCYHYDPTVGKYTPLVIRMVRAGGLLTLLVLGSFIGFWVRQERKSGHVTGGHA